LLANIAARVFSCRYRWQPPDLPEDVGRYAEALPQVKRKGSESRPAWYVTNRLVVRLHDPNTLVIRVPLSKRESLLDTYPDSFGGTIALSDFLHEHRKFFG
jgi:hypothetical protein